MVGPSTPTNEPLTNSHDQTPIGCWFVPFVFFILVAVGWGWWSSQPPIISSVWANYESVFNDHLASNLGDGFCLDFSDSAFAEQFSQLNSDGQYSWIFTFDGNGETAAHFPGVAYLMAAGDWLFADREFFIVGFAGLFLAFALALLINHVRLQFGWIAGCITTLVILADGAIFQATQFRSGDAMVAALIALAFVAFIHGTNASSQSQRSIWAWPFAGAMLGATTLFQSATSLWLIFLLPISIGYLVHSWIRRKSAGLPIEAFALFWIGVFVVTAPWWIRNCQVTGQFKPLGYSVGINLTGSYSQAAILSGGNLDVLQITKVRERELIAPELVNAELLKKEAFLANLGTSGALDWIRNRTVEIPQLIGGRIANHLGLVFPLSAKNIAFNAVLLIGALFGCWIAWRRGGAVILILIAISTLVTAATWSDFGRQLIPLRALIDVAFAIGVTKLVTDFRKRADSATV